MKNRDKKAKAGGGEYAREDRVKSEIGGFNRLSSKRLSSFVLTVILVVSVFAAFSLAIPSVQASPTNIEVNETGWWWEGHPDTFNASDTPIQHAIDNASDGDTINVAAGTYNENIVIDRADLALISNEFETTGSITKDTTLINGGGMPKTAVEITADGVTLQGFTIFNYGWGVSVVDSDATIDNCIIYDTGVHYEELADYGKNRGINVELTQASASFVTITNNKVYDNWRGNCYEACGSHPSSRMNMAGRGIAVYSDVSGAACGVLIDNNEVYGNERGISAAHIPATITNNYVHDNGFDGLDEMQWCIGIMLMYNEGTVLVENNIIEQIKAPWTQYGSISSGGIMLYGVLWDDAPGISHSGSITINNNTIDMQSAAPGINIHNPSDEDWDVYVTNNTISGTTPDPRGLLPTWGGIHVWNAKSVESVLTPGLFATIYPWTEYTAHVDVIEGNTIKENEIGIVIDNAEVDSLQYNNIYNNTGYGIDAIDAGATVNATNNWWGDASGPSGAGNGTGDAVSANVDYDPWLDAPYPGGQPINFTDATTETAPAGTTEIDAKTQADTTVTISATAPVNVTIAEYSSNPGAGFGGDIGKYIDVHVNDTTNVTNMTIKLFYTDADIAGLNENTLRMRWWNGTTGEWVACSNTGVNTTDQDGYSGYNWAYIDGTTTPSLSDLEGAPFGGQGSPPPAPPVRVPEFSPIGLAALIGLLSVVLAMATSKKIKKKK